MVIFNKNSSFIDLIVLTVWAAKKSIYEGSWYWRLLFLHWRIICLLHSHRDGLWSQPALCRIVAGSFSRS